MQVLHGWSDAFATKILGGHPQGRGLVARLLVIETNTPEDPGPHWAKLLDIQTLTVHERTHTQFATLREKSQFQLKRVLPTRAVVQILETLRQ